MKLLYAVLLVFVFILPEGYGVVYQGIGESIISENNVKLAEIKAKNNALKNALYQSFKEQKMSDSALNYSIPEVTQEFFKFIKSYKILGRYLDGYKVVYKVEADVTPIDMEKLNYMVSNVKTSAIYYVDFKGDKDIISNDELYNVINNYLIKNDILISHQKDFMFAANGTSNIEKVVELFANSKAQYLFVVLIDNNITKIDENNYCRVEIITNVYSRVKKYAPIKAIASSSSRDRRLAFIDAYRRSFEKTLSYICNHIIKLPDGDVSLRDFTMNIEGFESVAEVYSFLNHLRGQEIIINYTVGTYSKENINFLITSIHSIDDLVKRINTDIKGYDYHVRVDNNKIIVNFKGKND